MSTRSQALALAKKYPLFPCNNSPETKEDKKPLTKHGFKDATQDEAQINTWWTLHPDALVGVPTGTVSGLLVLDVDQKNGHDGLQTLRAKGWDIPLTYIQQTRSGGQHIYFANPPGRAFRCSASLIGDGLDIRAEGGYFVDWRAEGLPTLVREPLAPAPDWLMEALTPPLAPPMYQVPPGTGLSAEDLVKVHSALKYLNADIDYDRWLTIGMALHHATGGGEQGLKLWDDWSATGKTYQQGETAYKWGSFGKKDGQQRTLGSLFHIAREEGWLDPFRGSVGTGASEGADEGAAEGSATTPTASRNSPFRIIENRPRYPDGVYFVSPDTTKDGDPLPPIWICSPLRITAKVRDDSSYSWGRVLEFTDDASKPHTWVMPMEMLSGDGTEYRSELLRAGLSIAPGRKARDLLTQYIQTEKPNERAFCVERTGWHNGAFVLPDEVLGSPKGGRLLLQTTSTIADGYRTAGTLQDWQQNVAWLCIGNTRLVFAVSLGFAAPLLDITGDENGGVHYRSPSSTGKTKALQAAASVFGDKEFLQNWRATVNGLEGIAAAHNDALLPLDEIGQIDARGAGEAAYMLANGFGKRRANRSGAARPRRQWRILFLSSGEISLADHMNEAGKKAKAGQETRLVDIPADTGQYGLFEDLHGCSTGADFADKLAVAAHSFYGTAIREFLRNLIAAGRETIKANIEALVADFIAEHVPPGASGQVDRVAHRFALVAAGGELATAFGVTGWPVGEAISAAVACFQAWLGSRGGAGLQEERWALEQVRLFFEMHGESRFTLWNNEAADEGRPTSNRAGFRKPLPDGGTEFYVLPEVFKSEICKGLDARFVAKLLVQRGWVLPDSSDNKPVSRHRLPGMGVKRCYHFTTQILGGEA